jgi:hypothetical protein
MLPVKLPSAILSLNVNLLTTDLPRSLHRQNRLFAMASATDRRPRSRASRPDRTGRSESFEQVGHIHQALLGTRPEHAQRACHSQVSTLRFGTARGLVDQEQVGMQYLCERDGRPFAEVQIVVIAATTSDATGQTSTHEGGPVIHSRTTPEAPEVESSLATA